MRFRLANWIRTQRLNLAELIMDKRDKETLIEINTRHRKIIEALDWKLTNQIVDGQVRLVTEHSDAYHIFIENERRPLH